MYCEESIFNSIKGNSQLVFKYWELTREEDKEVEEDKGEELIDGSSFGDDVEFNGGDDDE